LRSHHEITWHVTTYNFAFLLVDVLFYMGIGYLSLLSYHQLRIWFRKRRFKSRLASSEGT